MAHRHIFGVARSFPGRMLPARGPLFRYQLRLFSNGQIADEPQLVAIGMLLRALSPSPQHLVGISRMWRLGASIGCCVTITRFYSQDGKFGLDLLSEPLILIDR